MHDTTHDMTLSVIFAMTTKNIKMRHPCHHAGSIATFAKKGLSMAGQTQIIALTRLVIYFWYHIFALNVVLKIRPVCGVVHI